MPTLSVLKFDDPHAADRMLIALQGMQDRKMIVLQDAAVVSWPQGRKRPVIPQDTHEMSELGALGGAFWGFLFGLIFFMPFLGAAIGAGTAGVLSGSLDAGGIDEEFIKRVGEEVTEGTSALFALTSGAADRERVVEEMRAQENFEIIWTDMPEEELREVREAFAGWQTRGFRKRPRGRTGALRWCGRFGEMASCLTCEGLAREPGHPPPRRHYDGRAGDHSRHRPDHRSQAR